MANRIGPVDQGLVGKVGNKVNETSVNRKVSRDSGSTGSQATDPVSTNDTVELTSSAQLLERLEKSLASLPAVDSARVAEIKAAIENGRYQIDADAIAEAMIRFDTSLGD
jgi:negative regulator of flagellin synthesis FlgM